MSLFDLIIVWVIVIVSFFTGFFASSIINEEEFRLLIVNEIENIRSLKEDCEKSLPRDQECVLIYEYVPAKRAEK